MDVASNVFREYPAKLGLSMKTLAFYNWLIQNHKDKNNPFGDFAQDTMSVSDFPKDAKDYETIETYLQGRNAEVSAMETFIRLFIAYAMEEGLSSKKYSRAMNDLTDYE